MELSDLRVYQLSLELSDEVWDLVIKWNYFEKDTVGKQLIRAVDSISANISEGYGRYSYKENKQFNYYSRGSLFETKTWLVKAKNRKLIEETMYQQLFFKADQIGKMLNKYIKTIGESPSTLSTSISNH